MLNIHFDWNVPFVDYLNACHLFMSTEQIVSNYFSALFHCNLPANKRMSFLSLHSLLFLSHEVDFKARQNHRKNTSSTNCGLSRIRHKFIVYRLGIIQLFSCIEMTLLFRWKIFAPHKLFLQQNSTSFGFAKPKELQLFSGWLSGKQNVSNASANKTKNVYADASVVVDVAVICMQITKQTMTTTTTKADAANLQRFLRTNCFAQQTFSLRLCVCFSPIFIDCLLQDRRHCPMELLQQRIIPNRRLYNTALKSAYFLRNLFLLSSLIFHHQNEIKSAIARLMYTRRNNLDTLFPPLSLCRLVARS